MENYGSFKNLAGDKKGMSAEEAYIMLKNLGLLGQEFVPGATSLRKLMEGDFKGAGSELNEWIPGGKAVENLVEGKDQDWAKNALDLAIVGKPLVKGVKKAATAIEKMPKGGKEGYIDFKRTPNNERRSVPTAAAKSKNVNVEDYLKNHSGVIQKPKNWEDLGEEGRARYLVKQIQNGKFFPHSTTGEMYFKTNPNVLDAHDYAEFMNYIEHRPELAMSLANGEWDSEAFNKFIAGSSFPYSEQSIQNIDNTYLNTKRLLEPNNTEAEQRAFAAEAKAERKAQEEMKRAEKKAKEDAKWAAKEAKWKAEREAALKAAEEKRLAKEAEEKRLAEEAEKQRLAEEAEAKRIADEEARKRAEEEEFERQFREEEGAERNRYADSLASVASREAVDNDINEWLYNKMAEEEKVNPVTSMDQFTGESFGGTPAVSNPTAPATGKIRPSYDHSREFNGGTFQLLDPIDRGTLKGNGDLGERIFDAQSRFYTPYSEPGEYIRSMSNGRGFRELQNKTTARDPYNEAGVINDMNIKLNRLIDRERNLGFTDEEIYRKFKPEFDEYQGKIERYKTRLNSPQSMFDYDGAITTNIPASPSEEINVLRSLGLQNDFDSHMGEIMDDTRDHYKDLMKRIYQYESRFPRTPRLTNDQFKRLKDMGIRPEDIDMYLAEHPEFH
jgi:hypothetical protein